MKPWMTLPLTVALLSLPNLGGAVAKRSDEVRDILGRFFHALRDGDEAAILAFYHRGSAYLPKNHPAARGLHDIARAYHELFGRVRLNVEHVIHNVDVMGDLAIVDADATGTATVLAVNATVPVDVKQLFVMRKVEGRWKIDRYMFNDNAEQPPPAVKP